MRSRKQNSAWGWMLAVAAVLLVAGLAWGEPSREHQVKAAFVVNFTQFVQWPESTFANADAPLVIGTVGGQPFEGALEDAAAGKAVAGHRLEVKHYGRVQEIGACQVLYVPASEDAELPAIMKKVAGKPVLTIGETDAFPWAGGCIRFLIEDGKVRFEINPEAAEKAELKISSKLMSLARIFKR